MVSKVSVAELNTLLAETPDLFVLDVREPNEYKEKHLPTAYLMPLATVPIRINEVDKNQTIYVVCRSGARSMQAAQWLDTQGYEAVNIEGGTDAWAESGFEIKTGD